MRRGMVLMGRELKERLLWMASLRYLAVVAAGAGLYAVRVMGVELANTPILIIVAIVLFYNVALHLIIQGVRFRDWIGAGRRIATLQIGLDFLALSAFVHLTGGIRSPLVFFYVFHAIISAIMLTRRAAYLEVLVAMATLAWLTLVEGIRGLDTVGPASAEAHAVHANLGEFLRCDPCSAPLILIMVTMTVLLSVYMTASLNRELVTREDRLLEANESLRELDLQRTQHVRHIAHDIKGPLGVIHTGLHVVLDGYTGPLRDQQRAALDRVSVRTERLIALVADLLGFTGVEATSEQDRGELSVHESVLASVAACRPRAEARGISITLPAAAPDIRVEASARLFTTLLDKLLDNALTYTPDSGSVILATRRRGDVLEISVGDTGPGIPPGEQDRIFELFFRGAVAREIAKSGNGLGLALVREIARAYGGSVRVESPWRPEDGAEPIGSRFIVRMDMRQLTRLERDD